MKILSIAIGLHALFLLSACSAPKRGCNDIRAINYSFDADEPCLGTAEAGDCPCIYPKLGISPSAEFKIPTAAGDSTIKWGAKVSLTNKAGQKYFLKRYAFYLSNIRFADTSGDIFRVSDSLTIPVKTTARDSGMIVIRSNPVLIGETSGNTLVGTFPGAGKFSRLLFTFGLASPENMANITSLKMPAHPLNTDSMYLRSEYRLLGGKFFYEIENGKAGILQVGGSREVNLPVPADLFFAPATDLTLKLKINFSKFFENVDFFHQTKTEMEWNLLDNAGGVFSLSR